MESSPCRSRIQGPSGSLEHSAKLMYALSEQTLWTATARSLPSRFLRRQQQQHCRIPGEQFLNTRASPGFHGAFLSTCSFAPGRVTPSPPSSSSFPACRSLSRHNSSRRRAECRCPATLQQASSSTEDHKNRLLLCEQMDLLLHLVGSWNHSYAPIHSLTLNLHAAVIQGWWYNLKPPRWLWRTSAAAILGGQAIWRIVTGMHAAHLLLMSFQSKH